MNYPLRLIEVDLPIRAISAHAQREKSIRHGHISTLHIWWARRPLAACRAVLCAALWPDPVDENCPQAFRDVAALAMANFAEQVRTDPDLAKLCADHWTRWVRTNSASLKAKNPASWPDLRYTLLDFIADFANWDASAVPAFLDSARLLTHIAHLALSDASFQLSAFSGQPTDEQTQIENLKEQIENLPRPLVVDSFAGGGSIPLEALRIGADAFASDLNPVAVLLNKVLLEYIPKYGNAEFRFQAPEGAPNAGEEIILHGLAEAVRYWGDWIKREAEKELAEFYPKDPDGATPIAYLWARTITCEGPACGTEVPLMRSLWLAKKGERSVALQFVLRNSGKGKKIDFEIVEKRIGKWVRQADPQVEVKNSNFDGTVRRGSATCPVCGYTTPVERVRMQLKLRKGGSTDARLFCVVLSRPGEQGRFYRLPVERDLVAVRKATYELEHRKARHQGPISLVPDEQLDINGIRHTWGMIYGLERWENFFNPRQALSLTVLSNSVQKLNKIIFMSNSNGSSIAIQTCLALVVDRQANTLTTISRWNVSGEKIEGIFSRQAVPIMWDYADANLLSEATGNFLGAVEWVSKVCQDLAQAINIHGQAEMISAINSPLTSDSVHAFVTDPPYYDAVPYSYLSDFFFVWLRRSLAGFYPDLLNNPAVPKEDEIVVDRPHSLSNSTHDIAYYERELTKAFAEGRRLLAPSGIGTIVFASKTTASWEAILKAVVDAGWIVTGSWPIDTEMEARVAAQGQARLTSSIHLVCRPREAPDGSVPDIVGDWRDVLLELPPRIQSWLPRLAQEGIVGADAIFACLGPALEIFSRYSRVEKASGDIVRLNEYLEHVWAAVAQEALATILDGGDAASFEPDARLTVIWFWVLKTADRTNGGKESLDSESEEMPDVDSETSEQTTNGTKGAGFTMEYDAARKLAQGLGADLQKLSHPGGIIRIKGNVAAMNRIVQREKALFGYQISLFKETDHLERESRAITEPKATLSHVDQRQPSLFDEKPEISSDPMQPFLPTLGPQKDMRTLVDRLKEGGTTLLDRLHQAMLLFGHGHTSLLGIFFNEVGVGKNSNFWRLAQALSALYPSGSNEKRWVDGVLARKKGLGY